MSVSPTFLLSNTRFAEHCQVANRPVSKELPRKTGPISFVR